MKFYAQLNENNICIGVSMLSGEVDYPNMIEIPAVDEDYLNRKYEDDKWSEEKFVPDYSQIELDRLETLEQSQAEQDEIIMQLLLGGM